MLFGWLKSIFREPISIIYHHIIWLILSIQRPLAITVEGPLGENTYRILPPTPHHDAKTYIGMIVAFFMDNGMEYIGSLIGQYMHLGPPVMLQSSEGLIQRDKQIYEQEKNESVNINNYNIDQYDQNEISFNDSGIDIGEYLPESDENNREIIFEEQEPQTTNESLKAQFISTEKENEIEDNEFFLETGGEGENIGVKYFEDNSSDVLGSPNSETNYSVFFDIEPRVYNDRVIPIEEEGDCESDIIDNEMDIQEYVEPNISNIIFR
ncbi:415_t:CDS:2 [Scutellospora calospora]|uniref:415_t:CDS:1 n=1 Tax=Scutellospora calospora TaxID=85575 RepID=A0ACA9JZX6_9GLOM|nr:415_t:CDS:2 [Scutellospora calospora]